MPSLIRTTSDPYSRQRSRLDGRDYVLDFSYNEREERFYLSVLDESEIPIIEGLKLICNWSLLYPYRSDPRCPLGEFTVVDLTGSGEPPTLFELGSDKRCQLVYWTRAELIDIRDRRGG